MLGLQIRVDDALQVQPLQAQRQAEQYFPLVLHGKGSRQELSPVSRGSGESPPKRRNSAARSGRSR